MCLFASNMSIFFVAKQKNEKNKKNEKQNKKKTMKKNYIGVAEP